MNKTITVALIASGLLLTQAPEAVAHSEVHVTYPPSAYYRLEHRRPQHMPYWLKRDRGFRKWYRNTRLRHHRHLSWHRLFDIYHREREVKRKHRRAQRFADNHYSYRHHDRYERRRYRH